MTLLTERFRELAAEQRRGFIPFVVAGHPDLATTGKILVALGRLNPVAIEVGVPFSDPTADGIVIQRASQQSLEDGTCLREIFGMLKTHGPTAPIILFSYYNPILQFGIEQFARTAAEGKIAGVLAVDLPVEAAARLHQALRRHTLDLIFLVTPTTSAQRLKKIAKVASGFIYAVSRAGVTGSVRDSTDESRQLVGRIRAVSQLPVAVGFGIATAAQAKRVSRYADAAVVGSRLVAEIEKASASGKTPAAIVRAAQKCAAEFARAI